MKNTTEWLTREQVATALGMSVRTLNRYRRDGLIAAAVGPFGDDLCGHKIDEPTLSMNAVRYHVSEVERFKSSVDTETLLETS